MDIEKTKLSYVIIIAFSIIALSCEKGNNKRVYFLLPDSNLLHCENVNQLDSIYPVSYVQYAGFQGNLNEDLLKDFTVILYNHETKVYRDIVNDETINSLKQQNIEALEFIIPDSVMSYSKVFNLLKHQYSNCTLIDINSSDNEVCISNKKKFVLMGQTVLVMYKFSLLELNNTIVQIKSFEKTPFFSNEINGIKKY